MQFHTLSKDRTIMNNKPLNKQIIVFVVLEGYLYFLTMIVCDPVPSSAPAPTLPTSQDPISSSLGLSAPIPADLQRHCHSPSTTRHSAPGCPAPGWRVGWDRLPVLPCCSRETLPLPVPTLWSPWPCCGLTHRYITGATGLTKPHNQKVF